MKNLLFWLYIIVSIILIAVGYTYWESRVTDSAAREKAVSTQNGKDNKSEQKDTTKKEENKEENKEEKKDKSKKPNANLFNNESFQSIYNDAVKDNKVMNITLVSTPYHTSDENTTVKDELELSIDEHIKLNEVEVSSDSSSVSMENINNTQPDLILLDSMTLNDYAQGVSSDNHIAAIENIYSSLNSDDIPVVIVGTRPEYNDSDFETYQQAEEDYFTSQNYDFKYIQQSDKWPNDDTLEDYYNVEDGLLTKRGVERWVTSISDDLFKEKTE